MTTKASDAAYSQVTLAIQYDINDADPPEKWLWKLLLSPANVHVVAIEELTIDQATAHGIAIEPCAQCSDKEYFVTVEDRGEFTGMSWVNRCDRHPVLAANPSLARQAAADLNMYWQDTPQGTVLVPMVKVEPEPVEEADGVEVEEEAVTLTTIAEAPEEGDTETTETPAEQTEADEVLVEGATTIVAPDEASDSPFQPNAESLA